MATAGYVLVLVVVVVLVMVGLLALAARARRRGVGHVVMGPFDEVWHPSGGHTHLEAQEQRERVTPVPAPGDRPDAGPTR
jgi:hypothetical protein